MMSRFPTSAAGALSLVLAAAPAPAQPQIHHPDSSPPRLVELSGPVEVPISVESNLPIVEARVNGQGPFRFGLETGANFVIVSPDVAAKLGLVRSGGPDDLPEYRVATIEVGAARFVDLPVSAMRVVQAGIDGVLGLPLYRDLLLTIDYANRRARFERGSLPEADGASILALTKIGPFWGLPIAIGGAAGVAVLDTRSTGGFSLTPESAAPVKFDGDLKVIGRARGAAIPETEVKAGRLAGDITIGRYTFPAPMATVRPLPPGFPTAPIVGGRVLSQFVITLDQRNARLRLHRDSTAPIVLEAAAPPPAVLPAAIGPLAAYVGRYGVREIRLVDGKLVLQRDGGPPLEMVGAGPDSFTLAQVPAAKIRFRRDASGAVTAVEILNRDGQWETETRAR